MKFSHLLFTLLFVSLAIDIAAKDSKSSQSTTSYETLHSSRSINRPRARGLHGKPAGITSIQCSYSREHICFELPADADFMEVTITDAHGMTWTGIVTQDEPCCDIPPMASPAQIECTVDMTATFTGTLVF